jgi:hypothetical protein
MRWMIGLDMKITMRMAITPAKKADISLEVSSALMMTSLSSAMFS